MHVLGVMKDHVTLNAISVILAMNINIVIIPGGMTS
jgi:hypothetical protein